MKSSILKFLGVIVFFALAGCSASVNEKPDANEMQKDSSLAQKQVIDPIGADSNQVSKSVLTNIYTKAINDYIDAIHQKDKTFFDTLFFGNRKFAQPDDFPDIILPEQINHARIILLSIAEAHGQKMKLYKKNSPLINLMGWVDKTKAEFVFVTFFPEFNHQYDCYINYLFNSTKNEYELETSRMEVLMRDKNGNPDHFERYERGKYVGDKAVK